MEHKLYWCLCSLFDTRTMYEEFTMIKLVLEWMLKVLSILIIIGSMNVFKMQMIKKNPKKQNKVK